LQTTVNIGVRDLKPVWRLVSVLRKREAGIYTANGKLRAASGKLQEVSSLWQSQFTHGLQQILYALAVHIEAVICLDRVHESCRIVSNYKIKSGQRRGYLLSRDQSSSILPKSMTNSSGVKALNAEYGNT